jgi:mono/diheme cytochrome c family protein
VKMRVARPVVLSAMLFTVPVVVRSAPVTTNPRRIEASARRYCSVRCGSRQGTMTSTLRVVEQADAEVLHCPAGCSRCSAARRMQGRSSRREETARMNWMKRKMLVGNKAEIHPLKEDAAGVADEKEAFSHDCAGCHGLDGQNARVPFADRMSPPVPSLVGNDLQAFTDGQLKWIIDYGIWPSGMPGSKGILSADEIWAIVLYLRHLPQVRQSR